MSIFGNYKFRRPGGAEWRRGRQTVQPRPQQAPPPPPAGVQGGAAAVQRPLPQAQLKPPPGMNTGQRPQGPAFGEEGFGGPLPAEPAPPEGSRPPVKTVPGVGSKGGGGKGTSKARGGTVPMRDQWIHEGRAGPDPFLPKQVAPSDPAMRPETVGGEPNIPVTKPAGGWDLNWKPPAWSGFYEKDENGEYKTYPAGTVLPNGQDVSGLKVPVWNLESSNPGQNLTQARIANARKEGLSAIAGLVPDVTDPSGQRQVPGITGYEPAQNLRERVSRQGQGNPEVNRQRALEEQRARQFREDNPFPARTPDLAHIAPPGQNLGGGEVQLEGPGVGGEVQMEGMEVEPFQPGPEPGQISVDLKDPSAVDIAEAPGFYRPPVNPDESDPSQRGGVPPDQGGTSGFNAQGEKLSGLINEDGTPSQETEDELVARLKSERGWGDIKPEGELPDPLEQPVPEGGNPPSPLDIPVPEPGTNESVFKGDPQPGGPPIGPMQGPAAKPTSQAADTEAMESRNAQRAAAANTNPYVGDTSATTRPAIGEVPFQEVAEPEYDVEYPAADTEAIEYREGQRAQEASDRSAMQGLGQTFQENLPQGAVAPAQGEVSAPEEVPQSIYGPINRPQGFGETNPLRQEEVQGPIDTLGRKGNQLTQGRLDYNRRRLNMTPAEEAMEQKADESYGEMLRGDGYEVEPPAPPAPAPELVFPPQSGPVIKPVNRPGAQLTPMGDADLPAEGFYGDFGERPTPITERPMDTALDTLGTSEEELDQYDVEGEDDWMRGLTEEEIRAELLRRAEEARGPVPEGWSMHPSFRN